MNRMKVALSTLALGLALARPGGERPADAQLESKIMTQMKAMQIVDKDGMITKKDAMKVSGKSSTRCPRAAG